MQKFFLGDLVRVADDLGKSMAHFPCGQDAIVLYSYSEKHCQSVAGDKQFGLYLLKDKQERLNVRVKGETMVGGDSFSWQDFVLASEQQKRDYFAAQLAGYLARELQVSQKLALKIGCELMGVDLDAACEFYGEERFHERMQVDHQSSLHEYASDFG